MITFLDRIWGTIEFFEKKSKLSFVDAYYSKISKQDVLPWHTDQAYSGNHDISKFNDPDGFYLKIFIFLTLRIFLKFSANLLYK